MIQVKGYHHIAILIKDLKRSKSFYEGILNLTPISRPDFGFQGAWYQIGRNHQLHLMKMDGPINQEQHFAIEVADIQETYKTLQAKGVRIVEAPGTRPHDGSDYMFCLDPDGNLIEITHHG
jgi:catechol 2,3-dioxygenase-like lactoylglutathione lyase family enzyme